MFGSTHAISPSMYMQSMYGRYGIICLMLALSICAEAQAQAAGPKLAWIDELRMAGKFEEARQALERIVRKEPNNTEAWWRLARTYVELGDVEESSSERSRLLQLGREAAQQAIEADSVSSNAHLSYAIALGRIALDVGTREKIEISRAVKEHVDRAIELDPANALAYHVRGRWNYIIADLGFFERAVLKLVYGRIPAASFEQAAQDYELAARLEDRVVNHLELGRTLLRMKEVEEARTALQRALDTPNADPNDDQYKEEAWELLKRIK